MLLRDHPLISCYGIPSWPPNWMLLNGTGPSRLTGEIGILRGVRANDLPSTRRCFVYMEYEQSSYLGCLLFYDITFGRHIAATPTVLLQPSYRGNRELGSHIYALTSACTPVSYLIQLLLSLI